MYAYSSRKRMSDQRYKGMIAVFVSNVLLIYVLDCTWVVQIQTTLLCISVKELQHLEAFVHF